MATSEGESTRYWPCGGTRTGDVGTDYRYTGQRLGSYINLYRMGSRWYDPQLGRWLSPDTIVPEPGDPQSLNRYSYVLNSPLRYTDPSGLDPLDDAWVASFRSAHGRDPNDDDRRDRLFSLMFTGSGPGGAWTDADWVYYSERSSGLWSGTYSWPGEMPSGVERFAVHVERLAAYYKANEVTQFVAAFAFVFGGIPLWNPMSASWEMATRPGRAWAAHPPLKEGTEGWRPELVDDENPAHHYAGLFYTGFHFGPIVGVTANWLRDGPLSGYDEPDLRLGDIAALQGDALYYGRFSIYALGDVLRRSLSTQAYMWPAGYPY